MSKGRSIELFFVDGTSDGMVTATIPFQWSGHVLVTRRTQLKAALIRDEASRPGVYLLIGEKKGQATLYVGETDELKARLVNHASTKDWWDTAILISSNGEPLNKAHVRYLEHRIFTDAKRINKITMDFGQEPTEKPLNEAARAHMDAFLENLYLVLPALRFDFLTEQIKAESPISATPQKTDVTYFTLQVPKHEGTARARLEEGVFIVEAGSKARKEWSSSTRTSNRDLFNKLVDQGILALENGCNIFAKSYVFSSTSAAASVVVGHNASGPASWMLEGKENKSYGKWETEQLESTTEKSK